MSELRPLERSAIYAPVWTVLWLGLWLLGLSLDDAFTTLALGGAVANRLGLIEL